MESSAKKNQGIKRDKRVFFLSLIKFEMSRRVVYITYVFPFTVAQTGIMVDQGREREYQCPPDLRPAPFVTSGIPCIRSLSVIYVWSCIEDWVFVAPSTMTQEIAFRAEIEAEMHGERNKEHRSRMITGWIMHEVKCRCLSR
jgi:hypothetical protein